MIADVVFQGVGSGTRAVTFGHGFAQGEVPSGTGIRAQVGGNDVAVQLDVKSTWPDGSIKHAVLTVDPGGSGDRTVTLSAGNSPINNGPAIDVGAAASAANWQFAFEVNFGSGTQVIDVDQLLQANASDSWLSGGLVSEERVSATVEGPGGRELTVFFDVRTDGNGNFETNVSATYANVETTDNTDLNYSYTIRENGAVQASDTNFDHTHHSTWTAQIGAINSTEPNVVFDIPYLQNAGFLPGIDTTVDSPYANYYDGTAASDYDPGESGEITTDMPRTGGRGDIGIVPQWTGFWMDEQTQEAFDAMIGNARAAGSINWHLLDPDTGLPVRADDPENADQNWPNFGGSNVWGSGSEVSNGINNNSEWVLELGHPAHAPGLAAVPYLVTGDRYLLDEVFSEAAYSIFGINPGIASPLRASLDGQVRGHAWAIRDIFNAANLAPDGDYRNYLEATLDDHLTLYNDFFVDGQTVQNRGFITDYTFEGTEIEGALNFLGDTSISYSGGYNGLESSWMQDHFGTVIGQIAAAGNAQAQELAEWMAGYSAERFLQSELNPAWAAGSNPYAGNYDVGSADSFQWIADNMAQGSVQGESGIAFAEANWGDDGSGYNYINIAWGAMGSLFSGTFDSRYAEAYSVIVEGNIGSIDQFSSELPPNGNFFLDSGSRHALFPVFDDGSQITIDQHEVGNSSGTTFTDGSGNLFYHARGGADTVQLGEGNHIVDGGNGNDTLISGSGDDWLFGGSGSDLLEAGTGTNYLQGDRFDGEFGFFSDVFAFDGALGQTTIGDFESGDVVRLANITGVASAQDAVDQLTTNADGDATLDLGTSGVIVFAGLSVNQVADTGNFDVSGGTPPDGGGGNQFTEGADDYTGTSGADQLFALGGNDTVSGLGGNDSIYGDGGDDFLLGDAGNDDLFGRSGNDEIYGGTGNDRLYGDGGNDVLAGQGGNDRLYAGLGGSDTLYGGSGRDQANFAFAGQGITANLQNQSSSTGDVLIEMEDIYATNFDDVLRGNGTGNQIWGRGGADDIRGLGGNDTLRGGNGDDSLQGNNGDDVLYGNGGADFVNAGSGADLILGGSGNDRILGKNGNDTMEGGDGNDTLFGDNQNDSLVGGQGADNLRGGSGNDTLEGGSGNDVLRGNAGSDVFLFNDGSGSDRVADFENGTDLFDLSQHSGATRFSDLTITDSGPNVRISFGDDSILVLQTDPSAIDASDFVF